MHGDRTGVCKWRTRTCGGGAPPQKRAKSVSLPSLFIPNFVSCPDRRLEISPRCDRAIRPSGVRMGGRGGGGGGAACTNGTSTAAFQPATSGELEWSATAASRRVRAPARWWSMHTAHRASRRRRDDGLRARSVEWSRARECSEECECVTTHCPLARPVISSAGGHARKAGTNQAICRLGLAGSFAAKATGTCGDCAAFLWEARADRLLPNPAILPVPECRTRTDDET